MFKNLSLKNFRSFALEQNIPISPITLIYGTNSSGKSSILKSILLMKQTLENGSLDTTLITKGKYADVGNFKDFINNQETKKKYSIKFEFSFADFVSSQKGFGFLGERISKYKTIDKFVIEYIYKNATNKNNELHCVNIYINNEIKPLVGFERTKTKLDNIKHKIKARSFSLVEKNTGAVALYSIKSPCFVQKLLFYIKDIL